MILYLANECKCEKRYVVPRANKYSQKNHPLYAIEITNTQSKRRRRIRIRTKIHQKPFSTNSSYNRRCISFTFLVVVVMCYHRGSVLIDFENRPSPGSERFVSNAIIGSRQRIRAPHRIDHCFCLPNDSPKQSERTNVQSSQQSGVLSGFRDRRGKITR